MDQSPCWNDVPGEIFQSIANLLPVRDVRNARLACSSWRTHFSYRPVRIHISAKDLIGDVSDIAAAFQTVMAAWHNIELLHCDCSLCTAQERMMGQAGGQSRGADGNDHHAPDHPSHPSSQCGPPCLDLHNLLQTLHPRFSYTPPLDLNTPTSACSQGLIHPPSPTSPTSHFTRDPLSPMLHTHTSSPLYRPPPSIPSHSPIAMPYFPYPHPFFQPTTSYPDDSTPLYPYPSTAGPDDIESDITILLPSPTTVRRWRLDGVLLNGSLFKLLSLTAALVNGVLLINIGPINRYPLPPISPTASTLLPLSTLPNLVSLSLVLNDPAHLPLIASFPALRRLALFFDWNPTTPCPFGDSALSHLTPLSQIRNLSLKYLLPFPSSTSTSTCLTGTGLNTLLTAMPDLTHLSVEICPQATDTFSALPLLHSLHTFDAIINGASPSLTPLVIALAKSPALSCCALHLSSGELAFNAIHPAAWRLLGSRTKTTVHLQISFTPYPETPPGYPQDDAHFLDDHDDHFGVNVNFARPTCDLSRLALLPNLRKLDCCNLRLTRRLLSHIARLSSLYHLAITGSVADGVTAVDVLAALLSLRQLTTLQLRLQRHSVAGAADATAFDDGVAASLAASLPSLQTLQVEGMRCGVSAAGLAALWRNPRLSRVCINNGVFERVKLGRIVTG